MKNNLLKETLFGVSITNATQNEILEYIITSLLKKEENYYIVTPNPEILVFANKNKDFKNILNSAKIALCDGVGLFIGARILGKQLQARVTGTDLMQELCKRISEKPITVGFLGGRGKIAERTADCLQSKFPGLKVVFAASEWPKDNSKFKIQSSKLQIKNQKSKNDFRHLGWWQAERKRSHDSSEVDKAIDILFVAYGFPKQEQWMYENLNKIPVRVMIGVGGAFDYVSKEVERAPVLIRKLGFEWLYRLIRQPWRIKRQFALLEFILLVLKEKLK